MIIIMGNWGMGTFLSKIIMHFLELTRSKNQYTVTLTASLPLLPSKPVPCFCICAATREMPPCPAGPAL